MCCVCMRIHTIINPEIFCWDSNKVFMFIAYLFEIEYLLNGLILFYLRAFFWSSDIFIFPMIFNRNFRYFLDILCIYYFEGLYSVYASVLPIQENFLNCSNSSNPTNSDSSGIVYRQQIKKRYIFSPIIYLHSYHNLLQNFPIVCLCVYRCFMKLLGMNMDLFAENFIIHAKLIGYKFMQWKSIKNCFAIHFEHNLGKILKEKLE